MTTSTHSGAPHPDITDELLSAYLDDMVTSAERQQVEAAAAADSDVAWRLATLRETVRLVRTLPAIDLPRSFVLTPAQVGQLQPAAAPTEPSPQRRRPAVPTARPPGIWSRAGQAWQELWRSGSPALRNAMATSLAAFLVIALAANTLMTPRTASDLRQFQQAEVAPPSEARQTSASASPQGATEAGDQIQALEIRRDNPPDAAAAPAPLAKQAPEEPMARELAASEAVAPPAEMVEEAAVAQVAPGAGSSDMREAATADTEAARAVGPAPAGGAQARLAAPPGEAAGVLPPAAPPSAADAASSAPFAAESLAAPVSAVAAAELPPSAAAEMAAAVPSSAAEVVPQTLSAGEESAAESGMEPMAAEANAAASLAEPAAAAEPVAAAEPAAAFAAEPNAAASLAEPEISTETDAAAASAAASEADTAVAKAAEPAAVAEPGAALELAVESAAASEADTAVAKAAEPVAAAEPGAAASAAAPESRAVKPLAAPASIEPAATALPAVAEPKIAMTIAPATEPATQPPPAPPTAQATAPTIAPTPASESLPEPALLAEPAQESGAQETAPAEWPRWLAGLQLVLASAAVIFGLLWWRSRRAPA